MKKIEKNLSKALCIIIYFIILFFAYIILLERERDRLILLNKKFIVSNTYIKYLLV